MDERIQTTQNPVETNVYRLPTHTDEKHPEFNQHDEYNSSPSFFQKRIPWHIFIIVMLVLMLISTSVQVHQYREYGQALAKEAYVISVSINLMEDNLMFKYGVLPEDIGFKELRSAWIDNPCYETSMAYYNALQDALDYFEQNKSPMPTTQPLKV